MTADVEITFSDACLNGSWEGVTHLVIEFVGNLPPHKVLNLTNLTIADHFVSFYDISHHFADSDPGDVVFYRSALESGQPLPAWIVFSNNTKQFSFFPSCVNASIVIAVFVTDRKNPEQRHVFSVNVVNQSPTQFNTIPVRDYVQGQAFSFKLFSQELFKDAENDRVILEFPASAWYSYDADSCTLSGTIPLPGTHEIHVLFYDECHDKTLFAQSYAFEVNSLFNAAPTCAGCGTIFTSRTILANDFFQQPINSDDFDDAEDDALFFDVLIRQGADYVQLSPLSIWLTYDKYTQTIYGTPDKSYAAYKNCQLSLQYRDPYHAPKAVNFTISIQNIDPEINETLVEQLKSQSVHTGEWYEKKVDTKVCTDADRDPLLLTLLISNLTNSPTAPFSALNETSLSDIHFSLVTGTIYGQFRTAQLLAFKFSCTDNFSDVVNSSLFHLEVFNTEPETNFTSSSLEFTLHPGYPFSFYIPIHQFWDADGDEIFYSIVVVRADLSESEFSSEIPWLSFLKEAYQLYGTPPSIAGTTYTLKVYYTDSFSPPQHFSLVLFIGNSVPVFLPANKNVSASGAPLSLNEEFFYQINRGDFEDADGDLLAFWVKYRDDISMNEYEIFESIPWLAFNVTTLTLQGTPRNRSYIGVNKLVVYFTDGFSENQSMTLEFSLVNHAPQTSAQHQPLVHLSTGSLLNYSLEEQFTDLDNDALTF